MVPIDNGRVYINPVAIYIQESKYKNYYLKYFFTYDYFYNSPIPLSLSSSSVSVGVGSENRNNNNNVQQTEETSFDYSIQQDSLFNPNNNPNNPNNPNNNPNNNRFIASPEYIYTTHQHQNYNNYNLYNYLNSQIQNEGSESSNILGEG